MTPSHPEIPARAQGLEQTDAADTTVARSQGALRCSDADRERTAAALHRAAGEGRLSMDETEERLAQVFAARHYDELDALTADLPAPDTRAGWAAVVALARQQLVDDVGVLTGRSPVGELSGRRRLVLVLGALALVVLIVSMVVLTLHGMVEGHEYGYEFDLDR
jgi:hypothetical protein